METMFKQNNKRPWERYRDYFRISHYALHIKKAIAIRVFLGLLVTTAYLTLAVSLAGVISELLSPSGRSLLPRIVIILVCILMRAFLGNYIEGYTKRMGGSIKGILREKIIDQLFKLGPGYQMDKRAGRFQSLITDGVEYLEPFFVLFIPQLFILLLSVIPMIVYLFTQSAPAALVVTLSSLLAIAMPHLMMPFYARANIDYWSDYALLNASFIDTMQGMNTLKLFNAEKHKEAELETLSERFRVKQLFSTRNSLVTTGVITFACSLATSVATVIVASKNGVSGSALIFIIFITLECVRPIGQLNLAWHSSMMGFSVVSELLEILNEPILTVDKEDAIKSGIDEKLPEINFENVDFCYSKDREMALNHLNLHISSGQTAAVVGSSGAGKTTLVNLLLRIYDVNQGQITINGIDLRDYNLEYLRSKISVVFQNTYLFYGTIRDNLLMAKPHATDEELFAAAKAANAHDFIMDMSHGYDTMVSERGCSLSGGQRQRIAIARAILKDAPILIMDEATSSVDGVSEALIQETLESLHGKFTTILIAHRLSTIQHAEKIFVLKDGSLAESGSHEELLAQNGLYTELIKAQEGGESE